jgi:hypothetical protein
MKPHAYITGKFKEFTRGFNTLLVIPTIRPSEVIGTVKAYSRNFRDYGHSVPIVVFDNSSAEPSSVIVDQLNTISNDYDQILLYVGPSERRSLISILCAKFTSYSTTINQLFGTNYGGSRNTILAYTVGERFISVDDDVRPIGMFLDSAPYEAGIVARGKYLAESADVVVRDQDIVTSISRFLGTRAGAHAADVIRGNDILDSDAPDPTRDRFGTLDTHISRVSPGDVPPDALIRTIQTHLTGDTDIEAELLLRSFLACPGDDSLLTKVPKKLCLQYCREALTVKNSRLTGAVLAYDNSAGGVYALPTALRCEDYIWRLHSAHSPQYVCAYTNTAQTHYRSRLGRPNVVCEWFNEQIAWALIKNMYASVRHIGPLTASFDTQNVNVRDEARHIMSELNEFRQRYRVMEQNGSPNNSVIADVLVAFDRIATAQCSDNLSFEKRLHDQLMSELVLYNQVADVWPRIMDFVSSVSGRLPARLLTI